MGPELFSLADRVALVTGGNGGLGRAIALGMHAAGARLAIVGRNPKKNEAVSREIGDDAAVFEGDVLDEASVERAIAATVERFGRIDILVNNAGLFRGGGVTQLSLEDWNAVIGSHLTGSFLCAKHAAPVMIDAGRGGKIINIGSMYSVFGPPDFADYAAAKTGLLGLTRALAVELAPHGIQANAVLGGWFETDLTRGLPDTETGERIRRKTPAGRWGTPEDVVGTCVFLASSASDFVTGAAIPVDGGYLVADRMRD